MPAGDLCTVSEQCFGDMECDREMCVMVGGEQGATCDFSRPNGEGNLMCNIGFYCAQDNTCQPLEKEGRPCNVNDQDMPIQPCGFGMECALISTNNDGDEYQLCRAFYS